MLNFLKVCVVGVSACFAEASGFDPSLTVDMSCVYWMVLMTATSIISGW